MPSKSVVLKPFRGKEDPQNDVGSCMVYRLQSYTLVIQKWQIKVDLQSFVKNVRGCVAKYIGGC